MTVEQEALIAVDLQPDFCEGGALAVVGGNAVAEEVGQQIRETHTEYGLIVFTQDWHWPLAVDPLGNCGHFALPPAEPDYVTTWPEHCVQNSLGAMLHPDIADAYGSLSTGKRLTVRKGQGVGAYSGFDGSVAYGLYKGATLGSVLLARGVRRVDVVGLAYDYCVAKTALAAVALGLDVTVHKKLTASVHPDKEWKTDAALARAGVEVLG